MALHSLISPSGAHRWLNCPASAMLEANEPDESSVFAEEGTLAHACCAKAIKETLGEYATEELAAIAERKEMLTAEMEQCAADYAAEVLARYAEAKAETRTARLLVEVPLDLGDYIPEGFGTSDAVIIGKSQLEVIDFKYGKGVRVDADHNAQMMCYALGALEMFGLEYDVSDVRMTIIQPRLGHVSAWTMSVADLCKWGVDTLAPGAVEALSGEGEAHPGTWCKFCKVKDKCRALARHAMTAYMEREDAELMTEDEIGKLLPELDTIELWVKAVKAGALKRALEGKKISGYKLVEGRSARVITDTRGAAEALSGMGYSEEQYLKPAELRTLTELEKLMGKKKFGEALGAYVTKPAGKPTLVPASDKRAEINSTMLDFADLIDNDN